ncbi:MAG: methyltransferase domain-containing protein [Rhodospirillales bacterium]|nr:methyltransferase domain-containing protein [Rhodospirillales bacterium]
MDRRTSAEVIKQLLPLKDATVVDVGCGDGWLVRLMTREGAHVTGIEVSPKHLAHAQAVAAVGDEHYMPGIAEDLPFAARSIDIIVFFNSLHHVDQAGLFKAMREAARVLKPGGLLLISEPLPEGPYFETMKPVHDETAVRNHAQEALRNGPEFGLLLEKAFTYIDTVRMKSFSAFHDRLTMINPHIREDFEEKEDELRALFEKLGTETPDGWEFDQPMRLHLMRRS